MLRIMLVLACATGTAFSQTGSILPSVVAVGTIPTFNNKITGLEPNTTYTCRMWVVCNGNGFWVASGTNATTDANGALTFQQTGHQFDHPEMNKPVKLQYVKANGGSNPSTVTVAGGLTVT